MKHPVMAVLMLHFRYWSGAVLLGLVLSWVGPAQAVGSVSSNQVSVYTITMNGNACSGGPYATLLDGFSACVAIKGLGTYVSHGGCTQNGLTTNCTCSSTWPGPPAGGWSGPCAATAATTYACPSGAVSGPGGTCTCMPGSRPGADNSCAAYECPKNGLTFADAGYGPFASAADAMKSRLTCVGPGGAMYGCTLEYTAKSAKCADPTHCWSSGSSATNGEYCDGYVPPAPNPVPDEPLPPPTPPCPANQCPGTVNGASVCVACGVTDKPTTETETKPDGTVEDKTTTTECNGTTCTTTTTTTTTGGGGTTVNVEVTQEPQPGFCEENPTFSACKEGRWSGMCGGGFNCEGDAIQCAIARDQHTRHCQMEMHTDESAAGVAMIDGNPHPTGHPLNNAEVQDVSFAGAIDQTNPIGGSCPADRVVSVGPGSSVTIPFSNLCGPLAMVGNVGVAVAMLLALFIAFKQ